MMNPVARICWTSFGRRLCLQVTSLNSRQHLLKGAGEQPLQHQRRLQALFRRATCLPWMRVPSGLSQVRLLGRSKSRGSSHHSLTATTSTIHTRSLATQNRWVITMDLLNWPTLEWVCPRCQRRHQPSIQASSHPPPPCQHQHHPLPSSPERLQCHQLLLLSPSQQLHSPWWAVQGPWLLQHWGQPRPTAHHRCKPSESYRVRRSQSRKPWRSMATIPGAALWTRRTQDPLDSAQQAKGRASGSRVPRSRQTPSRVSSRQCEGTLPICRRTCCGCASDS
mmetsp:Transcript_110465/g.195468  ORF Transcript_110465/g.195468 Transcript_110465/m.195468 type:complete len:279 (-) Transcript_110465:1-837(-)